MKNLKLFIYLLGIILVYSCEKTESFEKEEIESVSNETVEIEVAFPKKSGIKKSGFYQGEKIDYMRIDNFNVYQGDIIIPDDLIKKDSKDYDLEGEPSSKSTGIKSSKWPNNTVYYSFDQNFDGSIHVLMAIEHIEKNTAIKFVERTNQKNYIYFTKAGGCWSYVGMVGGKQTISLDNGCQTKGIATHEILHALGFNHEHGRSDRDKYINIYKNNMVAGTYRQFVNYSIKNPFDTKNYSTELDFGSIMMYGSYAFSKNRKPTITKKDGSTFIGQRIALSKLDIEGLNEAYSEKITYVPYRYYTVHGKVVYRWNNGKKDIWIAYGEIYKEWRQVVYLNGRWVMYPYPLY